MLDRRMPSEFQKSTSVDSDTLQAISHDVYEKARLPAPAGTSLLIHFSGGSPNIVF
jgi:hypothetical protein